MYIGGSPKYFIVFLKFLNVFLFFKVNSYIPLWHGIILLLYPGVKERGTAMNKNKHLLSDERIRIEELLKEGRSFKAIANELGKSPTTVSREIRSHTITKNVGSPGCP